jgi:hypothetical protein
MHPATLVLAGVTVVGAVEIADQVPAAPDAAWPAPPTADAPPCRTSAAAAQPARAPPRGPRRSLPAPQGAAPAPRGHAPASPAVPPVPRARARARAAPHSRPGVPSEAWNQPLLPVRPWWRRPARHDGTNTRAAACCRSNAHAGVMPTLAATRVMRKLQKRTQPSCVTLNFCAFRDRAARFSPIRAAKCERLLPCALCSTHSPIISTLPAHACRSATYWTCSNCHAHIDDALPECSLPARTRPCGISIASSIGEVGS